MKLVKVTIKLQNREEYLAVLDDLCKLFLSHTGSYEAPVSYLVTVYCSHVSAEQNLDALLERRKLYGDKLPVVGTDEKLTSIHGIPITMVAELHRINNSMLERAA